MSRCAIRDLQDRVKALETALKASAVQVEELRLQVEEKNQARKVLAREMYELKEGK